MKYQEAKQALNAGKSLTMKGLKGVLTKGEGTILLDNKPVILDRNGDYSDVNSAPKKAPTKKAPIKSKSAPKAKTKAKTKAKK